MLFMMQSKRAGLTMTPQRNNGGGDMKDRDLQFYDKNEIRRIMRYECAWCEQRLDQSDCGAIYESCTESNRAFKRYQCLKDYKPRIEKPSKSQDSEGHA